MSSSGTRLFTTRKMYRDEVLQRERDVPLHGVTWYRDDDGAYILVNEVGP